MKNHLEQAVDELLVNGMAPDEVEALFRTMRNGVLMDPGVGKSVRRQTIPDGDLRFRFIEQAEGWLETWEHPEALIPHVRHFAVQVANLYLA